MCSHGWITANWGRLFQIFSFHTTLLFMFFCCPSLTFRFLPFLAQWFSVFLMLWLFNTIPRTVVTPNYKIILLLFHNSILATIMNPNANIWCTGCLVCHTQRDFKPQIENCSSSPLVVSQQLLTPSFLTLRCLPSLFASSHLCEVTSLAPSHQSY